MQTETFTLGPLTMYVSEDHRFGTDAFLLAYYANVKPDSVVCDLCTGCGIIPLIFCKNVKPHLIYAVDIQEEAIKLLKMSVEKNHLENRLQPVLADLRELKQSQIGFESMDIVTANPPYMTSGSGFEKLARPQAVARHELMCNIDDVLNSMRENKIEPKSITFVFNSILDKPWLFLVTGKKGGKSGMIVEKPMILRNDDKSYTEEYTRLYD